MFGDPFDVAGGSETAQVSAPVKLEVRTTHGCAIVLAVQHLTTMMDAQKTKQVAPTATQYGRLLLAIALFGPFHPPTGPACTSLPSAETRALQRLQAIHTCENVSDQSMHVLPQSSPY